MNKQLIAQINSVNRSLRIIDNCCKKGIAIDEKTLESLLSDLTEVTATFNKLYEDIMELVTKEINPN